MVGDTALFDRGVYCGGTPKVFKRADGYLLGIAGSLTEVAQVRDWFLGDGSLEVEFPSGDSEAIIVKPDGTVIWRGRHPQWVQIEGPYHAIGSGFKLAIGAMAMGATALEAIKICCDLDDNTRRPVKSVRL